MDGYLSAPPNGDAALRGNETDTFEEAHRDAALDEALCCTFPASDPVALNFVCTPLASLSTELIRRAFPRKSS